MTEPVTETREPGWEDYIEIFYAPSRVFARRGTSWGGPLVVLVLASALVILGTYSLLREAYAADGQRAMAEQLAGMSETDRAEAAEMSRRMGFLGPVTMIVFHAILPLVLGIVLWLVGKLLGATQALGAALMVAAFSYFPRILYWPLLGLQAALVPEGELDGFATISLSPARFVDPANIGLAALLSRLDIFVLWTTVLLALGLKVTGRITTEKAIIAGVVMWLVGSLQPLFVYLRG